MPLKTLSHSKMEQYRNCPLSFYFDHIIYEPSEPQFKDYAQTGKVVHDTIKDSLNNMRITILDGKATFMPELEYFVRQSYAFHALKYTLTDKEHETIAECLNNFCVSMEARLAYCDRLNMVDNFQPIKVEARGAKTIGDCLFRGDIDVLFHDEKYWAIDWKTSSSTTITDVEIRQATRYAILLGKLKQPDDTFEYLSEFYIINLRNPVNLSKSKITITQSMIDEQLCEISQIWEASKGEDFIKNPTYSSCFFCTHKMKCQSYTDFGRRRQCSTE